MLLANNSLVVEFLSEELPPIKLESNIGTPFSESIYSQLQGFLTASSTLTSFIAPRRFGCVINEINFEQADQQITRKGPAIATSLKDGAPTPALLGFAKSCATEWKNLEQRDDGYFYYTTLIKGKTLDVVIGEVINTALKKIHIAKSMRWGATDYQFVRPLHGLVVMFNDKVLDCEALGLVSSNQTSGHRFMSNGKLTIPDASKYLETLKNDGKVVAEFAIRRNLIEQQIAKKAAEFDLKISPMDGLLDEVTALVEWPEVLVGSFDKKFLEVPQECLILSMAKNQKYFALVDNNNKLSNKFLFVANLISKDPQVIIEGNQKVLTARLADAEFFYEFDKRTPLADFVKRMTNVVYHNKLGSQYERIERLQKIATAIAPLLNVNIDSANRAAYLLKADLATEMVGEFPELQGIMGNYYALASGESADIANAIEKHYYPRFSGDELPNTPLATVVSLADKLETLVGIWGIGLIPTGDKDPYALRRAALGIVRILLESEYAVELSINELLKIAISSFNNIDSNVFNKAQKDIYIFILQRLENFLLTVKNLPKNIINAIMYSYYNENTNQNLDLIGVRRVSSMRGKINFIDSLSNALTVFVNDSKAHKITQASKRMVNILKKNEELLSVNDVKIELLSLDGADRQLFNHHEQEMRRLEQVFNAQQWYEFFEILLTYADLIETFFNDVTIVTDDIAATANRMNLLFILARYFNMACRLSELA